MMEQTMNYVKPELIVVAVVLYFIGMGLKQSQTVKDKYIPLILSSRIPSRPAKKATTTTKIIEITDIILVPFVYKSFQCAIVSQKPRLTCFG